MSEKQITLPCFKSKVQLQVSYIWAFYKTLYLVQEPFLAQARAILMKYVIIIIRRHDLKKTGPLLISRSVQLQMYILLGPGQASVNKAIKEET